MDNLTIGESKRACTPQQNFLFILSLLLSTGIFIVDTQIKLGVAVGALYIIPVLMTIPLGSRKLSILIAFLCTVLIVIKWMFWSMGDAIPWMVFANRSISIFVVWVTVILGLYLFQAKKKLHDMESLLTVCAWTKQVKVGDEWISFDKYLSKYLGFKITHSITKEKANRLIEELEAKKR